ncbi:MAG: hypothetical protein HRU80_06440 [Ignavibacteriales bacterium]|nr:MAG: hypothetical protein HRU80_06440 [Ignavibacteriales bacterium]
MKKISYHRQAVIRLLLLCSLLILTGSYQVDSGKNGILRVTSEALSYVIKINNITLPLDNNGGIGDVRSFSGAYYDGKRFLFSGGFYLSGLSDGEMWGNGYFTAARVQDYLPGPVGSDPKDPKNRLYVITSLDLPFGDAWQLWRDAVSLGADFYDGNGDGKYEPVDLNGNGRWDTDEDRPDIIGDITAWCVTNDAVIPGLRRFTDVSPRGIEIQQTVFGFAARNELDDILYIRYRIINKGTFAPRFDSVYFSLGLEPEVGTYYNDLTGSDTLLSGAYAYDNGPDPDYGNNSPTFFAGFVQGPPAYIPGETFIDANNNGVYDIGENSLSSAVNFKGGIMKTDTLPGAKNLLMTSFTTTNNYHNYGMMPNTRHELRYYQTGGLRKDGNQVIPCTWWEGNGSQKPDECGLWNPKFLHSGDPVAGTGWINTYQIDQTMMVTTGTFTLHKDQPVDIVAAYVVGRSPVSSLLSVNAAKKIAGFAKNLWENQRSDNTRPDDITVDVRTGDGFIDLTWNTAGLVNYQGIDSVFDKNKKLHAFFVTGLRTNNVAASISGAANAKELARYAVKNNIHALLQKQSHGGFITYFERPSEEFLLDTLIYSKPDEGRIRLRITEDPFTSSPLIKGKEYYFTITSILLDHNRIYNQATGTYGPAGDYIDTMRNAVSEYQSSIIRVVYGSDLYEPAALTGQSSRSSGFAGTGGVKFLTVNSNELTGDTYTVEFKSDTTTAPYSASYSLRNNRTGEYLISDSKSYNFDTTDYSGKLTEGFLLKVKNVTPLVANVTQQTYTPAENKWFKNLDLTHNNHGAEYCGKDITGIDGSGMFGNKQSTIMKANLLRAIEVRFGQPGKAYRYMNGFVGTSANSRRNTYRYAAGIRPIDTLSSRGGAMGKYGIGYVDVPFQVWVKDSVYGEERQLAAGFVEKSTTWFGGNPDGSWFPGTDVTSSLEAIIVFDADYDPAGSQIEYTGGVFGTDSAWADLRGYQFPPGAATVTDEQKRIAASPLFNAMYVIGLSALTPTSTFTPGDIFRVPVAVYPYTDDDVYTFSTRKGGDLTLEEKKELFEKVNVFPNPFFANNTRFSHENPRTAEESFVTFTNLPETVTIKIYTLSGSLIRTLTEGDKQDGASSPFLRWDLKNQSGSRIASGMYLAIVTAPGYGEKLLKLGIIQQKK